MIDDSCPVCGTLNLMTWTCGPRAKVTWCVNGCMTIDREEGDVEVQHDREQGRTRITYRAGSMADEIAAMDWEP